MESKTDAAPKEGHPTKGSGMDAIKNWIVKRGILYGLTQTPMIAFVISVGFRWTTLPIATAFTVILAFVVLPMWISYRRNVSNDPEEPAHHFLQLALWALVPYVVYNLARIPMYYLLGTVFWNHWAGYGAQLIGQGTIVGQPFSTWSALISGTFIHSVQGYVLALGFYVLFKRRTLASALLYVWVMLSLIYATLFPMFILIDFRPGPKWYFVVWWAHFWMAIAAWYVPKLYGFNILKRLKPLAKTSVLGLVVLIYLTPVIFVFWKTATWQLPLQNSIDQNTFRTARMVLNDDPVLISKAAASGNAASDQEAFYRFILTFGPRSYKDYFHATKAVEVGPIQVVGRVLYKGEVIASCFRQVALLESPSIIRTPAAYLPAVRRIEFSNIEVDCTGRTDIADRLGVGSGGVLAEVQWNALTTLTGDRNKTQRTYGGIAQRDIVGGTFTPNLLRPDPSAKGLVRQVF